MALARVIDAFVGVEAIFGVGRLHFAGGAAFLFAGVKLRDGPGAALTRQDVLPAGLDVAAQGRDEAKTGDDYSAHSDLQKDQQAQPAKVSLSKPCRVLERSRKGKGRPVDKLRAKDE